MKRRGGYALMAVVIALAVVSIVLASITVQMAINRKTEMRREAQVQSLWLARAGLERAATRILAAAEGYRGESVEILPASVVRISVERQGDIFRVTSEAEYLGDLSHPVVRAVSQSYRRVVDGSRVTLQAIPGK